MRDKNMEEVLLRVRVLEHRLKECSELLCEVGVLLESGEFAQAADLEAPAVENEEVPEKGDWGMFGDEKAPWE